MKIYVKRKLNGKGKGKGKPKGKGKVHSVTGHEGPEDEQRYSSTLSLTSALDWGGCSTPRPGRPTPGKETRYPLYRRMDGPQGRSERVRKNLAPTGIRSPGLSARIESLYRLRYPGPKTFLKEQGKCVCTGYRLFESKLLSRSQYFPEGSAAEMFRCFRSFSSVLERMPEWVLDSSSYAPPPTFTSNFPPKRTRTYCTKFPLLCNPPNKIVRINPKCPNTLLCYTLPITSPSSFPVCSLPLPEERVGTFLENSWQYSFKP